MPVDVTVPFVHVKVQTQVLCMYKLWNAIRDLITFFTKYKTYLSYIIILSLYIIILSFQEIKLSFKEMRLSL